jgi:hypothetical protein
VPAVHNAADPHGIPPFVVELRTSVARPSYRSGIPSGSRDRRPSKELGQFIIVAAILLKALLKRLRATNAKRKPQE